MFMMARKRVHSAQHTHTHTPKYARLQNAQRQRDHTANGHGDTRTHSHTHGGPGRRGGRTKLRSRPRERPARPQGPRHLLRATGGGAVPRRRARPLPAPGRRSPSRARPPPGCPVPRGAPARLALPAASCVRLPRPALPTAPRVRLPRPALPANRPAPRSPGAASDQLPASAALNLRNNKQPDMSESAAAGPPFLPPEPPAGLDWEGAVVPPRQLVPGPRATHAHTRDTRTHTHTHILPPPPRAAPSPGHTLNHGPGAQHTRHIPGHAAGTHGHTHSHPLQTRSYTRIPGTLGIHSDPRSPGRRTPPTPDTPTRTHRAHTAHGHTRSGPVPTPSHTYTDLTSIHTTHAFPDPHAGRIHRALPATHTTNTQHILRHTINSTPRHGIQNANKCNT